MARKHIVVSGRVQGVGFRYHASLLAQGCHLTGWVRNLSSGEVELELQGKEEEIGQFLSMIEKKSMFIRIDELQVSDCMEIPESDFSIRYEE